MLLETVDSPCAHQSRRCRLVRRNRLRTRRSSPLGVILLFAAIACFAQLGWGQAAADSLQVTLGSGELRAESFVALQDDWTLVTRQGESTRTRRRGEWFGYGEFRPRESNTHLLLTDASQLVAPVVAVTRDAVVVDSRLWGLLSIPSKHVAAIIVAPPRPWELRDRLWDWLLAPDAQLDQHDTIRFAGGDEIKGELQVRDQLPVPAPLFLRSFRFKVRPEQTVVEIKVARITAIRMAGTRNAEPFADTAGVVGWEDGSRLLVARATIDERTAEFQLACGWKLRLDKPGIARSVRRLRTPSGRWRALSATEPLSALQVPLLQQRVSHRRNRAAGGTRLRIGRAEFLTGIGMFGRSRLAYEIPQGAVAFAARIGIDQAAGSRGSVRFRVYLADESGSWRRAYESRLLRGGESPLPVHVALKQARGMALVIDSADRGDVLDYADWANARWVVEANE